MPPQQVGQAPPPQQPYGQQPPQQQTYQVGGKSGTPGWLVALLVAVGLTGVGYVGYRFLLNNGQSQTAASTESPFEEVPEASAAPIGGSRLARQIEATGFRITEGTDKRLQIQFLVVNHSGADIGDLEGEIHLKTTEGDDISTFNFKTSNLAPYESIEFKAVMSTTMRAYEVPDWQFLRAELEITSPTDL